MELGVTPSESAERPTPSNFGVLAIGHSHLTAVQIAYDSRKLAGASHMPIRSVFVQLLTEELRPSITTTSTSSRVNKRLETTIQEGIQLMPARKVMVLFISGNEYHFIGMFNHPRAFDFSLPGRGDIPFLPGAEIIPTSMIQDSLRRNIRESVALVPLLREVVGGDVPVFACESPPPIPSNEYLATGRSAFSKQIAEFGVSPPWLRYKLWRLQSGLFEHYLTEAGATYLKRPDEAVDQEDFMKPLGWHPDGVHGSVWFGELLLQQIENAVEGHFRRDSTSE